MADIGIDLGTTNSAVAVLRNTPQVIENQGNQTTPSVVAWDDGELLVGQPAKDMAMVLPSVVSVKRAMGTDKTFKLGDKTYTPVDISAMILKDLKKAAEEKLGEPVDSAVITIPAYFGGAQKDATKKAGEQAGFQSVRLLAEPIAAALAYGAEDLVLVYDLGGGTFDVAIIDCFDYKMIGLDGDNYLGGDDFDHRLIEHLAKAVKNEAGVDLEADGEAKQLAKSECERVKKELSQRQHSKIRFQTTVQGKPVMMMLKVTREEFESMIMDLVDRTIEKVEGAIAKAKEKEESFTKDDIDTVLLVGGSTYIPLVERKLKEFFGRAPAKTVNPDLAVTLGAAVHTATGPAPKDAHRIRVDPVPTVTAASEIEVKGRTSPGARVAISGGATPVSVNAESNGKFAATVPLNADKINSISIVATSPDGEERKTGFEVRHDGNFKGKETKPRKTGGVGAGLLPRALGIRLSAQDDLLGVIISAQQEIPCSVETRDYCMTSRAANTPGQLPIDVFEGEIPYSPLNTHLATLTLETPASPSTSELLEIKFQITEDHLLTVTASMVNFPDRLVTAKIKVAAISGSKQDVVERADIVLKAGTAKLRPEQKAKLSKSKQGLLDLCTQFKHSQTPECYAKIKEMGLALKAELDSLGLQ